jgi:hypothetical protein
MIKRRGAEGSIYTGKRQDTRRWSILPHHNIKKELKIKGLAKGDR